MPALDLLGDNQIVRQIDLHETDKAWTLAADLPGIDEKDIDLSSMMVR
ncbi:MAG: hypothetical protein Q7V31_05520 [Parvibaculum sp.]|nr:hypothetical protein [Parvibaculum sp.]MDO8838367.1 hypothetical protein [Parvibaculum sp.]